MSKVPDKIYEGTESTNYGYRTKAEIDAAIAAAGALKETITLPAVASIELDDDFDVCTIIFNKPVFQNALSDAELKAAITIATDGETFGALNASDTVAIANKVLTITFNTALSTATNLIKIDAETLIDALGNLQAEYTSAALDASGE